MPHFAVSGEACYGNEKKNTGGLGHAVVAFVCEVQDLDLTIALFTLPNGKCILCAAARASEYSLMAMGNRLRDEGDVGHREKVGTGGGV